ncbi:MAG: hypothetical protein AB7P11_21565, partial [Hydrogenophaga sp.]|uniref:hypothetical protein n=1 Tax=Hydrogenophaga sp. TaxID=1904254 RepID=UPI003D12E561
RREMIEQGFPLDRHYPREVDKEFQIRYGGLLQNGVLQRKGLGFYTHPDPKNPPKPLLLATDPLPKAAPVLGEGAFDGTLSNNETTIEYHPTNPNIVIAGSNGSGGQRMSFSTNGGQTWGNSGALPGTCCDPAIEWSPDGSIAFAATLGQTASGCAFSLCASVYWSFNNGQTWQGPVHTSTASSDKEFIHVDRSPSSPYFGRVYLTWHQGNVMQFARSTAMPVNGGAPMTFAPAISFGADERGIGSDITTDRQGRIYYVYPSVTNGSTEIRFLRSDDGGDTFVDLNGATAGLSAPVYDLWGDFDFAIPAMESRRVFIYAATDVDSSGGPNDGRIYVAFTDENQAAGSPGGGSGSAAASHGWIVVRYSDDQGLTWNTAATPHSTADQTTVDRFQPWMDVDGLGNVHIGFQDTRNSGTGLRDKADWYYAVSSDGGASWTEETRVSSVVSQNINNGQEWGDYNGLAVAPGNDQISMTWTDNRIVTPPSTVSQRSFAGRVQNVVAAPTYLMGLNTNSADVCAGSPVAPVAVALTAVVGYTGTVTLSTPGLNAAVFPSAVFTPNPVSPTAGGVSATLNLSTSGAAAGGPQTVTVRGTDTSGTPIVRNQNFTVNVFAGMPAVTGLVSPADGAIGIAPQAILNWSADAGVGQFLVEVATDAGFGNIVFSQAIAGTQSSVQLPAGTLNNSTDYFWRVTASNACGTASSSVVRQFRTQAAAGDCDASQTVSTVFSDNVENGSNGFVASGTGASTWSISTARPFSGASAWLAVDLATTSNQLLVSPPISVPSGELPTTLQFFSDETMEDNTATSCWDGGLVEFSTNGTTWTPFAPSSILFGPYVGSLSGGPASGLNAWCGDPLAYNKKVIDLSSLQGQTVQFRFRMSTDGSIGRVPHGWYVDDIRVQSCQNLPGDLFFRDGFE